MTHVLRRSALAALLTLSAGAGSAYGATLTFDGSTSGPYVEDGFLVSDARIVSGNCESASGDPCLALNDNETSVVTSTGGDAFSIASFWFQLLGEGTDNTLTVTSSAGGTLDLSVSDYGFNDGGQVFDFTSLPDFGTLWSSLSSLTFTSSGGGNVRVDDITVSGDVAPVPLPAAAAGLLAALGLLGAVRARRKG